MHKLVSGVHKFQSSAFADRRELFERLASGQNPHSLFITCADSRIDPSLLTQTDPGELFILRNVGNLVPCNGNSNGGEAAGIEYALAALDVEHIVVCGHSKCGAMTAVANPELLDEMSAVRAWLSNASATRRILTENYGNLSGDDAVNVAIQENVLMQLCNLQTHPIVAARLASGRLTLHGWVYRIETGEVFGFEPRTGQFEPIAGSHEMPRPHLLTPRIPDSRMNVRAGRIAS